MRFLLKRGSDDAKSGTPVNEKGLFDGLLLFRFTVLNNRASDFADRQMYSQDFIGFTGNPGVHRILREEKMIDFHTHMFPHIIAERTVKKLSECVHKKPDTDGTYEGLLKSSREAGIDCSVVLPIATKPSQFRTINDFASR